MDVLTPIQFLIDKQLMILILRFLRAKKYGFTFFRTKSFVIPSKLKFNGTYLNLSLPSNSTYIELFRDILLDDEYFLLKLKNAEIKNLVDVGANLGIFSITARLIFPNSVIHCYEPNSQNLKFLNDNGTVFNFKVFNEAVSLNNGRATLIYSSKHDTAANLKNSSSGDIVVSDLSTIIKRLDGQNIDLLKLDCEGQEFQILRDIKSLKTIRFITLEYHLDISRSENQLHELKSLLKNSNFKIIKDDSRNSCLGVILAKNERF
jgi:FkbM family methyltransferase